MRRVFTTLAMLPFVFGLIAQNNVRHDAPVKKEAETARLLGKMEKESVLNQMKSNSVVDLFVSDFSDPSVWTIEANSSTEGGTWNISSTSPPPFTAGPFASTTADNGFAWIDSDAEGDGQSQDAWIRNTDPIDLSAFPSVKLTFQHYARKFQETNLVEFSTDGTNWVGAVEILPNLGGSSFSDNPVTEIIDPSDVIGGSATAYFRFRYIGAWDWAWCIDDVVLFETLENELILDFSVLEHVGSGNEYARIPASQIDELTYSAQVFNFGFADQTNTSLNVVMTDEGGAEVFNTNSTPTTMIPGDTLLLAETFSTDWQEGLYSIDFAMNSDEEADTEESYANNVDSRFLRIDNGSYGLDGIDTYPTNLTSLGTNSFIDAGADEFGVMVQYTITEEVDVYGVEFYVTSTTVEGGVVYAGIVDSVDVLADNAGRDAWLVESEEYAITADDVSSQFVQVLFEDVETLEPGQYYAILELNSFENSNDIRILDDLTIPQPAWTSAIWLAEDAASFTNSNAFAIRLMMDESGSLVSTPEFETAEFIGGIRPNPANSSAQFDFNLVQSEDVTILITDALGRQLSVERLGEMPAGQYVHNLDLNRIPAGIHQVTIRTQNGQSTTALSVVK